MSSSGYQANPGAIDDAAGVHRVLSDAVSGYQADFESGSAVPEGSFGSSPEATGMGAGFQEYSSGTARDMGRLSDCLAGRAQALSQNADNYRAADKANSVTWAGPPE